MKHYRLLRNNKESGPYSADDLIKSGLRTYDLIWIDGKSAAWRYPCEIDEFKSFVPPAEEQPFDRFYKKKDSVVPKDESHNKETQVTVITTPKKEKPRIRIKADTHKIETPTTINQPVEEKSGQQKLGHQTFEQPARVNVSATTNASNYYGAKSEQPVKTSVPTTTSPEWQNMLLDWEQEKKAVKEASLKKEKKEEPEIKFSQSLDEIKERYVETILKPKSKSSGTYSNRLTVAVLIVAILGVGVWMGLSWSRKADTTSPQHVDAVAPSSAETTQKNEDANINLSGNVSSNDTKEFTSTTVNEYQKEQDHNNSETQPATGMKPSPPKKKMVASPNNITEGSTVVNHTTGGQSSKNNPPVVKKGIDRSQATYTPVINKSVPEANPDIPAEKINKEPASIFPKSQKASLKISDYISVSSYNPSLTGAVGVKLRVHNISDIPVDMVMMDVQYYDANGKFRKGETIYLRNIGAGQTISVQAPDDNTALKIDYKISLVSSEENNLYLIAD